MAPSLLLSLPVSSPYFYVTSCPIPLLLYHFLCLLPAPMSLPEPSPCFYVTSCPLSLLLCHILSPHSYVNWWHRPLLLWFFLTPLLYVTSCPLPSTTCLTKIHTQISQLRSILEMKDIGPGRERSWRERSSSMASADLMEISRTGIAPQCDPLLKWRWGSAFIPLLGPGIKCRLPVKWELCLGWGNSLQMRSILEERFNQVLWIQHTEDGRWDALILMGSLGRMAQLHHPNLLYWIVLSLKRVQRTWKCHLYP